MAAKTTIHVSLSLIQRGMCLSFASALILLIPENGGLRS